MMIQIRSEQLRAALRVAADETDVRFYLRGLCVDTERQGHIRLVSTDGHRMLVQELEAAPLEQLYPAGKYIIPAELVRQALRELKPWGNRKYYFYLPTTPNDFIIQVTGRGQGGIAVELTGKLVEARYADYARTIPDKFSGEHAEFDFGYLGDFQAIAEMLNPSSHRSVRAQLTCNGNDPSLVTLGRDEHAFGIIMPMRSTESSIAAAPLPLWFRG